MPSLSGRTAATLSVNAAGNAATSSASVASIWSLRSVIAPIQLMEISPPGTTGKAAPLRKSYHSHGPATTTRLNQCHLGPLDRSLYAHERNSEQRTAIDGAAH